MKWMVLVTLLTITTGAGVVRAQLLHGDRGPNEFRVALGQARRALQADPERGAAMLKAAAAMPGADGRALADLGWVLARQGETFDGLVALARAAERSESERVRAALFYSTGVAQEASGRPRAAMGAYLWSQQLRPNPRVRAAAVWLDARHREQGLGVAERVAWLEPIDEERFVPDCESKDYECESLGRITLGSEAFEVTRTMWREGYDDNTIMLRPRSGAGRPILLDTEWRGVLGGEWGEVVLEGTALTQVEGRAALRIDTQYTMVDHDACEAVRIDVARTFLCFAEEASDGSLEGCLVIKTGSRAATGPGRLAYPLDVDFEAECGVPRSLRPADERAAIFSPPRLPRDTVRTSSRGIRVTGPVVPPALERWQPIASLRSWSNPDAMDIVDRERPFEGVPYELRRDERPERPEERLDPAVEAMLAPRQDPAEAPPPEPVPEWGERALRTLEDL